MKITKEIAKEAYNRRHITLVDSGGDVLMFVGKEFYMLFESNATKEKFSKEEIIDRICQLLDEENFPSNNAYASRYLLAELNDYQVIVETNDAKEVLGTYKTKMTAKALVNFYSLRFWDEGWHDELKSHGCGRIHYTLDDKNIKMHIETIPLFNEKGKKA